MTESFVQGLALDKLEHEGAHAARVLHAVDRADVGVIQRGEQPRFALEACEPIGVAAQRFGKNFDGDVATELRIRRAVDLSHTAGAQRGDDLVRSKVCTRCEHYVAASVTTTS